MSNEEFLQNHLVQDAVMRQLEIIGEASNKISDEFQGKNKQVPWKDITGMRNKLIHDYMGVDLDAVWDTVVKDIPDLKMLIMKINE